MRNNWIKYISFIFLVVLLPFTVNSQNNNLSNLSIVIEFKSDPVSVNITHTPLKYNKAFALSFTMDDSPKDIYTHAFKLLNGGNIEGTDYEPMYYTDGCGNDINFSMSAAIFSMSNFNDQDMHVPGTDFGDLNITWPEIIEMYQNGCGIFNHGLTTASTGDYGYLIARNHSYIKYKTQDATPGGIHSTIFVNPNGAAEFTTPAFDQGYNAAYRSIAYGVDYLNVFSTSSITNLDKLEIGRQELTLTNNFSLLADQLYQASNTLTDTSPWASTFSHTVTGQYGGISFDLFKNHMQHISSTYGKNGLDNIWFTTEEEVLDYVLVRDAITINQETVGNEIRLTFSGTAPEDLRNYALSLHIASTATDTITAVTITGDTHSSYSGLNTQEILINTAWDGRNLPTALEMAEFYVDSTESSLSQNVANIAMDYVNILTDGTDKDNLKARLCAINEISMPESFCRTCSTNIGDDEIICKDDCIELTVSEGSSYIWSTGETTQNIEVCPDITTDYSVKVLDEFGCEAKDTVSVIVNPLPISQTSNDTIVCKNNCVKIWVKGGSNFLWDTGETTDTIQVCPAEAEMHYVTVYNEFNCETLDSVFVDVFPTINADAGNVVNLFEGECTTLTANGGLTYQWSTGATTNSIEVCPTETTKYFLTAYDNNGCSDLDSVMVILRSPLKLGDVPVGVNSIVVIFEDNPSFVNINKTPLKYNKEFALSFHIKNANKDIYSHAFPFLNGGSVDGVNYPGLTFTDGCDNEVNFKMGTSLYSFAADGLTDIHTQSTDFINWDEAIELYQAGWGIFSQGLLPDNSGDPSYSIARNHSWVKFKTFGSVSGGIPMNVLMNPLEDNDFTIPATNQNYRAAFSNYPEGIQYYDISLIPDVDILKMGSNTLDNQESIAAIVDLMHNNYDSSTRLWASAYLSTITDGSPSGYSFSTFRFYMNYIESQYGSGGLDNIWVTNEEEVWDYITTYELTTVHQELLGDRLLITFSGSLPSHLNNYALSLLIESHATIQSIEVDGGSNSTYKIKADTSALINLNWDGKVQIADSVLAENYVVIA